MKHIKLELSVDSCRSAIAELNQYKVKIEPKLMEVCRRLAEIGIAEAKAHLVLAAGNTDATISEPIQTDRGYKFSMGGSDVYFIEFGTGDDVNAYTPNVSVLVAPGSWSETHSKRYMNYGFWYYSGAKYEGTPAYMPMYYAGRAIRNNAKRIAQEVFSR